MKISELFSGMNDLLGTSSIEDSRYSDNVKSRAIAHVINYMVYPERCDDFWITTPLQVVNGLADIPEKYLFATLRVGNDSVKRVNRKEFETTSGNAWTIKKTSEGFKIAVNFSASEIFLEYVEKFVLDTEPENSEFPLMNFWQSAVEHLAVTYMLKNDQQDDGIWRDIEQEGDRLLRRAVGISREESSGSDSYVLNFAE